MCRENIRPHSRILEIAAGPSNECSQTLNGIGNVTGIDIDPDVKNNRYLSEALVFDGRRMPLPDASFDACVSSWILEHVEHPSEHFREVARILRPGGVYCLRTPSLYHYVSMGARWMPHSVHLMMANRLRKLGDDAHDPYPAWFRSNTRSALKRLCRTAGLSEPAITMVEPEPSHGRRTPCCSIPSWRMNAW